MYVGPACGGKVDRAARAECKAHLHFTGWHTACCILPQRALEAGMLSEQVGHRVAIKLNLWVRALVFPALNYDELAPPIWRGLSRQCRGNGKRGVLAPRQATGQIRDRRHSGRFLLFRNFACQRTQISSLIRAVPSPRGALANVINVGRDAVDAGGVLDEQCRRGRRSRVVLAPQCRRQVCEKKRRRRCQTSVVTGESAK